MTEESASHIKTRIGFDGAGFSRGAFAARCLANFVDKVGLLWSRGLPFLWTICRSRKKWGEAGESDRPRWNTVLEQQLAALDYVRLSRIHIKVLAEWDPVSAMGLPLRPGNEKFSFVSHEVPSVIENAFVAVSLDEKRGSFKPSVWGRRANDETKVLQCGFVGCHSDIGGGNKDVGLSTVSLLWMVSEIENVTGADFQVPALLQFINPFQPPRIAFQKANASHGKRYHGSKPAMQLLNCAATSGMTVNIY
ncbi:hypothetical protein QQS21_009118 [Conoideocrella luteorostrata]|uniref:T6SS Phospholipase effector Tle1-like catalytic domain-containing protein n=1 Tax=Conoideocrella luteorostrata TaxID=1105319 RepID=A0AAJ0FVC6_9HYPO|nr:hypothetical protein QQS21_009118 [Conoideocrella luteorostrata]